MMLILTMVSFLRSDSKDEYPWGFYVVILIVAGFSLGRSIAEYSKRFIDIFFIFVYCILTYSGFKNWTEDILFGEERLWRSLPWHNPTGIIYGFLSTYFAIRLLDDKKQKLNLLYAIFFSSSFSFLIFSGSRGSILITLLVLLIISLNYLRLHPTRKNLKNIFLLIISTIIIFIAQFYMLDLIKGDYNSTGTDYSFGNATSDGSFSILGRTNSATNNFSSRIEFWKNGLKIFLNNPLLGTGPGTWASTSWKTRGPLETLSTATHNDYIQFLAEYGIIFFIFFMLFLYSCLRGKRFFNVLKLAPALVIILHSSVDFNIHYPVVWFLLSVYLGSVTESSIKIHKYYYYSYVLMIPALIITTLIFVKGANEINEYNLGKTATLTQVGSFNYLNSMKSYLRLFSKNYLDTSVLQLSFYLQNNPTDNRIVDLKLYTEALEGNDYSFRKLEKTYMDSNWVPSYLYMDDLYISKGMQKKSISALNSTKKFIDAHPGWEAYMNNVYLSQYYAKYGSKFNECNSVKIIISKLLNDSLKEKPSYSFWDSQTPIIKKYCNNIEIPENNRLTKKESK